MTRLTEYATLIGADDAALAQNKFTASISVALVPIGQAIEITGIHLKQGYAGGAGGANLAAAGILYFFRSNPAIAAGTAIDGLTEAQAAAIIGRKAVLTGDWSDLANTIASHTFYFDNAGLLITPSYPNIWVAFLYTGATSFNSAAGDDETLQVRFVYS